MTSFKRFNKFFFVKNWLGIPRSITALRLVNLLSYALDVAQNFQIIELFFYLKTRTGIIHEKYGPKISILRTIGE